MAILVDDGTRLLVQGITGREGAFHTGRMLQSGTNVVAGVTPGKGGQDYEGVPIFDTVEGAVEQTGANASVIFVPPPFAADAIFESLDSGLSTVCCITEGIPVHDMMRVAGHLGGKNATLIGPNCPGVLSPEKCNVSIMPGDIFMPGNVGVVSRSGTLTYQIVNELTQREIGQSSAGEIGGNAEQLAAEYVRSEMSTPVVAYIAGFTAPEGKTMGHAGAIVSGGESTAGAKSEALREAGIRAATNPSEVAERVEEVQGPEAREGEEQHSWWQVVCLTGVDYFSTLGYIPGIAALAAGALSPVATLFIVLLTLFGALPMYRRVAEQSPSGQGSISMLERLLSFWKGKVLVLCLLGFVATGWLVTITLSAADAAVHVAENPLVSSFLHDREVLITLVLLALLGAIFLKGFKEAIGIAIFIVGAYLILNLLVVGVGFYEIATHPQNVVRWQDALLTNYGNPLLIVGASLLA